MTSRLVSLFFALYLGGGVLVACDQTNIKSLFLEPKDSLQDSIFHVTEVAFELLKENQLGKAECLALWALDQSQKIGYVKGLADSYTRLGALAYIQDDYTKVDSFCNLALVLRSRLMQEDPIPENMAAYASVLTGLVTIKLNFNQADEALSQLKAAQKIMESTEIPYEDSVENQMMRMILYFKGRAYFEIGLPDSAADAYFQSLALAKPRDYEPGYTEKTIVEIKNLNDVLGIEKDSILFGDMLNQADSYSLSNLGKEAYAIRLMNDQQYEKAMPYLFQTLNICFEQDDYIGIARNNNNLGLCYMYLGETQRAEDHLLEAQKISQEKNIETQLANVLVNRAFLKKVEGDWENAKDLFCKAYLLIEKRQSKIEIAHISDRLSEAYSELGQLDSALFYKNIYGDLKYQISYSEKEAIKLINEKLLEATLKTEKLAQTNKWLKVVGGIIIVSLLTFIYFLFIQRRQRKRITKFKLQEKGREQAYLLYQADGMRQERSRLGKDLHDGLGQLLNSASIMLYKISQASINFPKEAAKQFQNAHNWIDQAKKDLRIITHDFDEQSLSEFGLKKKIEDLKLQVMETSSIKVEVNLFELDMLIPLKKEVQISLILEELVNNAKKYSQASKLEIQLTRHEAALNLIVEDDGDGFDLKSREKKGLGIKSIKERVGRLEGEIEFDTSPGNGTTVIIDLPNIFLLPDS